MDHSEYEVVLKQTFQIFLLVNQLEGDLSLLLMPVTTCATMDKTIAIF